MNHALSVRSPQAPGDILPIPLESRPLRDIGFPPSVAEALADDGVGTVGQLLARFPSEDFTTIAGIGPGRQATIATLLGAYRG